MEDKFKIYRTIEGDTWDKIAQILYENSMQIDELISWNEDFRNILVFEAGREIRYKDISKTQTNIAPWRR